jgi:hypothetical protein
MYNQKYTNPSGASYWANNESKNYFLNLKPTLDPTNTAFLSEPLTPTGAMGNEGKFTVSLNYASNLPLEIPEARVDNGEWKKGYSYEIDVNDLKAGEHVLETRVAVQNNANEFIGSDAFTFVVKK